MAKLYRVIKAYQSESADPLAVSLEEYRGREVAVRAIIVGEGDKSSVIWRNTTIQLAQSEEKTPADEN